MSVWFKLGLNIDFREKKNRASEERVGEEAIDAATIVSLRVRRCERLWIGLYVLKDMSLRWEAGGKRLNPVKIRVKAGKWYHAALVYAGPGTKPIVYLSSRGVAGLNTYAVQEENATPTKYEPLKDTCKRKMGPGDVNFYVGCKPSVAARQRKVTVALQDLMIFNRAIQESDITGLADTVMNAHDSR